MMEPRKLDRLMRRRRVLLVLSALLLVFIAGCIDESSIEDLSEDEMIEFAEEVQIEAAEQPDFIYGGRGEVEVVEKPSSEGEVVVYHISMKEGTGEYSASAIPPSDPTSGFSFDSSELKVWQNEHEEVIEGVDHEEDVGQTFDVDLANRTRWTYQNSREELKEVVTSDVEYARGSIAIGLDPDEELVAALITRTFETVRGESPVELRPGDIEEQSVSLVLHVEDMEFSTVRFLEMSVETDDYEIEYLYHPPLEYD